MTQQIWFTSDTHFNDEKIAALRGFSTLVEMEELLIANWNLRVRPGDLVYHLGDFAISWGKKSGPHIHSILERLNGNKWLIRGNHDRAEVTDDPLWEQVKDKHSIKVDLGDVHKRRIVLDHNAARTWTESQRGAWMLFGHSHGRLPDSGLRTWDVGVDNNNLAPINLNTLWGLLETRPMGDEDEARAERAACTA